MTTPENDERRQQMEWLRGDAHIAHEIHHKSMSEHMAVVGTFSNAAMRAPAIAAAGAIAALLGFFSANYRAIAGTSGLSFFNEALILFGSSVLLTVLAPGLAYFSQLSFLWSLGRDQLRWERPFVQETGASKRLFFVGTLFQVLAIAVILGSIGLLIGGGWRFLLLAHFVSENPPR
ncbi:hypothetical protein [Rhizobium leguminosarum]|uniref:hypothetical protein n=1 Tax=Rhizobium leguminosarum TaxID=384 RepID=UPI00103C5667|nr:hypothetical protein [Rhizobium leguminosarum]TCA02771.1 hypothetical protein E0H63_17960 [Rhizobium leguminosarum bv. viciae]